MNNWHKQKNILFEHYTNTVIVEFLGDFGTQITIF
jgi:hypothetical protein